MVMEVVLFSCWNSSFNIFSERKLSELEYTDDLLLLSEDPGELQVLLVWITAIVCEMHLAPSKCKMLLKDKVGPKPNHVIEEEMGCIYR